MLPLLFCVCIVLVGADRVLEMLGEVNGSLQDRLSIGRDIRKEAFRFKRHKLVAQIDSWIQAQQLAAENQSVAS